MDRESLEILSQQPIGMQVFDSNNEGHRIQSTDQKTKKPKKRSKLKIGLIKG